ncbi:hypothetical protein F5051DRAFT_423725 [Lentinula edodes]|nr:hypothetical protein F5051DRAFT_423725 [Lentinula edodes]
MLTIYIDEATGSDTTGQGTEAQPYQSLAFTISTTADAKYLICKDTNTSYDEPTQFAIKKGKKGPGGLEKKGKKEEEIAECKAKEKGEEWEKRERLLEESKSVVLTEDTSLAKATKRVGVFGWVHPPRPQKDITFVTLCDGTGYLQVVLSGRINQTYHALTLTLESTVELVGMLQVVSEGKTAPGGYELIVDHWQLKTNPLIQADLCHLVLHGETASAVTPPCLVQTMVEGGATLFKLDYYSQLAFLAQSSQLYLETCLPSLGNVFCVQESFWAESSHMRRHLSGYTHLEAELRFINFGDLMTHIDAVICESVDILLAKPLLSNSLTLNSNLLHAPFCISSMWMGIKHPKEDKDENGKDIMVEYAIGDDIAEAAERQMTDIIGKPHFYIKRMPKKEGSNAVFTKSCSSRRISDYDELITAYNREGMDPSIYYWYTDQRRHGTCEHGGYGLGVERLLAWLADCYTVRECSLYPRWSE